MFTALLLGLLSLTPQQAEALGPSELPPVNLAYEISADLRENLRDLTGVVTLTWKHPAPEALTAVPIHLYLNAFSHSATTWASEAPGRFNANLYKHPDPWGWIELVDVVQAGAGPCSVEYIQPDDGNPLDRTLAAVQLAAPVPPGRTLQLRMSFTARLPIPIARTGAHRDYAHVAQWFPKLGMYDPPAPPYPGGWAARQFHGSTEFYAEFADYTVSLRVPAALTVVASGERVSLDASPPSRAVSSETSRLKRYVFRQRAVHDFTFVVGRQLWLEEHVHDPAGPGGPVRVRYLLPASVRDQVPRMRWAAERTLDIMGQRVGPYPYGTLTLVQPPWRARGTAGMEYPTVVTGIPGDPLFSAGPFQHLPVVENVLAHEIIHNYFQGLVATNEQQQAFLDEGFTSYWTHEVMQALHGERPFHLAGRPYEPLGLTRQSLQRALGVMDEALVRRPAALFYPGTGTAQIYRRSSLIFQTAAARFGQSAVDRVFSTYFHRYRFGHPTAADFLRVAAEIGDPRLAAFLEEAFTTPRWPDYRLVSVSTEAWTPPRGRVPTPEGVFVVAEDTEARAAEEEIGLDAAMLATGGRVTMVVVDPGFVDGEDVSDGRVIRRTIEVELPAGEPDTAQRPYTATVRMRGSRWRNLPVTVTFRWEDGVEITDRWDGRAAWREYRFLRRSPLQEVQIDPEDIIKLDTQRVNNAWRREPDADFLTRWVAWLTQGLQWMLLTSGGWW